MQTRSPHTLAGQHLTSGDDREQTPCVGRWQPYDQIIDATDRNRSGDYSGPTYDRALSEARGICGGCPVRDACFRANKDERWVKAILRLEVAPVARTPRTSSGCGSNAGYKKHWKRGEKACTDCKKAHSDHVNARKKAARARRKVAA